MTGFDHDRIAAAVREILIGIGEDPDRDGLQETPDRVARAYAEMYAGLHQDPADVLDKTFDVAHDEMVLVKDIELWSSCEHHLVPFTGVAHVGYIPQCLRPGCRAEQVGPPGRCVCPPPPGPGTVDHPGGRCVDEVPAAARGVIVVVQAEHMCMTMRGVRKQGSKTVTSAVRGQLRDPATRAEAMSLILGG